LVTAGHRGEAFVTGPLRDQDGSAARRIVLTGGAALPCRRSWPAANYVDELVNAKLRQARMTPSDLRRLDLLAAGDSRYHRQAPHGEQYNSSMADKTPRSGKLVTRLLERKEFARDWAMKWAGLLMIRVQHRGELQVGYLYANWLTDRISRERADQPMVREVLTATGGTFRNPPPLLSDRTTRSNIGKVTQRSWAYGSSAPSATTIRFDAGTMNDY